MNYKYYITVPNVLTRLKTVYDKQITDNSDRMGITKVIYESECTIRINEVLHRVSRVISHIILPATFQKYITALLWIHESRYQYSP